MQRRINMQRRSGKRSDESYEELWNGSVWLERVLCVRNMYNDGTSLE